MQSNRTQNTLHRETIENNRYRILKCGDAEDWTKLRDLTAQLEAATSKLNVTVNKNTNQENQPQQQQQAIPAGGTVDLDALIQQKRTAIITPDLLSSAQARLAELQAEEQQKQEQPQKEEEVSLAPLDLAFKEIENVSPLKEASGAKPTEQQKDGRPRKKVLCS